ncbi:hypothetical protein NPIL_235381 [Nephila pilipes]|uniref:Uncharacterized protein n=1 Tax=Nephila pilipes TaxID=299642 RepID=A0A8X6P0H3_NEPPI|nr:hypothetical protein NPIL_235381 [Nephila pilipes]
MIWSRLALRLPNKVILINGSLLRFCWIPGRSLTPTIELGNYLGNLLQRLETLARTGRFSKVTEFPRYLHLERNSGIFSVTSHIAGDKKKA